MILIGIIALIFLGPRRMPEMARKLGKMMSDFRTTTNEFKSTWEREVNFEEEEKAMRTGDLPAEPIPRADAIGGPLPRPEVAAPQIKAVDPEVFAQAAEASPTEPSETRDATEPTDEAEEKINWL